MKYLTLALIFVLSFTILTGCQKKPIPLPESAMDQSSDNTATDIESLDVPHDNQVSSSTDPEVINAELDGTVIMEEDFSDL